MTIYLPQKTTIGDLLMPAAQLYAGEMGRRADYKRQRDLAEATWEAQAEEQRRREDFQSGEAKKAREFQERENQRKILVDAFPIAINGIFADKNLSPEQRQHYADKTVSMLEQATDVSFTPEVRAGLISGSFDPEYAMKMFAQQRQKEIADEQKKEWKRAEETHKQGIAESEAKIKLQESQAKAWEAEAQKDLSSLTGKKQLEEDKAQVELTWRNTLQKYGIQPMLTYEEFALQKFDDEGKPKDDPTDWSPALRDAFNELADQGFFSYKVEATDWHRPGLFKLKGFRFVRKEKAKSEMPPEEGEIRIGPDGRKYIWRNE